MGVDKKSLPVYNGTGPISAGTTLSLVKVVDPDTTNGNITFDRCWIVNTGSGGLGANGSGPVTLLDSDMESQNYQAGVVDHYGPAVMIVRRTNLSGGDVNRLNGPGTLEQVYIHGLISSGDNHCEGFTRRGGTDQGNILDSWVDSYTNPNHTSATIFLQSNAFFDNLLFEGNLLTNGTGNGSVALEAKDGNSYGTHLVMRNNRIVNSEGKGGYTWDYNTSTRGLGWGEWSDNYVNDSSQPDNKGAAIPEP